MKISNRKARERGSKVYALFFMKKIKQRVIAKKLWVTDRTIRRYVQKSK